MPCTLQPWEIEFEERRSNEKLFGRKLTDAALNEEVACELARMSREGVTIHNRLCKSWVRKWVEHHDRKDLKRAQLRADKVKDDSDRAKALGKLTEKERRLLGL